MTQQGGHAQACAGFDGGLQQNIDESQEEGFAEETHVARGQGISAAVLDAHGEAREEDIEEQEEERGDDEEEEAEGEGAKDLDFEGTMGEDEGAPGHVEEEDIEGGRV